MGRRYPTMYLRPDDDPLDADWIKTLSWDLPTDLPAFLRVIGGRRRLKHFMTLPAARAMPFQLRQALGLPLQPERLP